MQLLGNVSELYTKKVAGQSVTHNRMKCRPARKKPHGIAGQTTYNHTKRTALPGKSLME